MVLFIDVYLKQKQVEERVLRWRSEAFLGFPFREKWALLGLLNVLLLVMELSAKLVCLFHTPAILSPRFVLSFFFLLFWIFIFGSLYLSSCWFKLNFFIYFWVLGLCLNSCKFEFFFMGNALYGECACKLWFEMVHLRLIYRLRWVKCEILVLSLRWVCFWW